MTWTSRNNVGSYLMGVDYDAEENCIVVRTSTTRYILDASHHKEVAVRELVDLLESMRQTCLESQKHGMAIDGEYDWVTGPQANPPAKELWYER